MFKRCKNSLSLSLSLSLLLILFVFSIIFTACDDGGSGGGGSNGTVVTIADISGIAVPAWGEAPVTEITETDQYTGTINWSPDHNLFNTETVYTAYIDLTEKEGFTFEGVTENFFKVAGADSVTNDANSGYVTVVFPKTGKESDINVVFKKAEQVGGSSGTTDSTGLKLTFDVDPAALTIDNITVTGATKGALSGSGTTRTLAISNITVANGKEVTVTITSPTGYKITGSPQEAVVYRAPIVAPIVVTIADISGITVPAWGEAPVTEITETDQYTGTIDWSPDDSSFVAETVYTATITLTAKSGYTFTGVGANFFIVAGVTSVTNDANSGVVTAVFPKTGLALSPGFQDTYSADGVSFQMAYVPGGFTFPVGTSDNDIATVDNAYWIGETEVTYELWEKVYAWATDDARGANKYVFGHVGQIGGGPSGTTNKQHPVTMVSWRDSMVWCNALTEWYNEHKEAGYDCVYTYSGTVIRDSSDSNATACDGAVSGITAKGFRLLTANEWQLAARYRGSDTTNVVTGVIKGVNFDEMETKWTKGDSASGDTKPAVENSTTLGNYAVYYSNSDGTASKMTKAVKAKFPNALSLYDMSGNVSEICFEISGSWFHFWGGDYKTYDKYMGLGWKGSVSPLNYGQDNVGFRFGRSH